MNMLIDITDRKRAEEIKQRFSSIVQFSDDAIISKNLQGVIESWKEGAERIFGYTAKEAIGQSVEMLIPPDRIDEEWKILNRLRRGEHTFISTPPEPHPHSAEEFYGLRLVGTETRYMRSWSETNASRAN